MEKIVKEFRVGRKRFATLAEAEAHARWLADMAKVEPFLETFAPGRSRARARKILEDYMWWSSPGTITASDRSSPAADPASESSAGASVEEETN
jgi:hypothetical protein